MPKTIIIGAGLTGIAAARHLKKDYILFEKYDRPGGLCGSVERNGFTFDYAGHFLHLHHPESERQALRLMRSSLARVRREARVHTCGRTILFPFQANLYHLPEKVKLDCIEGVKNRPRGRVDASVDLLSWSLATFGSGITKHFMRPYNEKLWTVSAKRLTADWTAPFVPRPTVREIEASARREQSRDFGYNAGFYYPREHGCQAIVDAFSQKLSMRCGTAVTAVDYRARRVKTADGATHEYGHLVSTQPLHALLAQMRDLPANVAAAAKRLDWSSVLSLNLGVRLADPERLPCGGAHWMYFPEKKYPFYRVGVYSNVMASMAPEGHASLYVELSRRPGEKVDLRRMVRETVDGLKASGMLAAEDKVVETCPLDIPCAYVIFDKYRSAAVACIQRFLEEQNIYSIGRYGAWEYSFMERSLIEGKETAEKILAGK